MIAFMFLVCWFVLCCILSAGPLRAGVRRFGGGVEVQIRVWFQQIIEFFKAVLLLVTGCIWRRRVPMMDAVVVEQRDWWIVSVRPQMWDEPGALQGFVENGDNFTGVAALDRPEDNQPWRAWLNQAMDIQDGMSPDSLQRARDVRRWWRGHEGPGRHFVDVDVPHMGAVVTVPSAGSRHFLRLWCRFSGELRRPYPPLTPTQRLQNLHPDAWERLVAKRYRKELYLQSGCLSFIPFLERAVESAHRERMMFEVRQFACIIGEEDDEMVPYVSQRSCWNDFLRRCFPARNSVWQRRETARLVRLVRIAKVVVGYTRMQLGTLQVGSALEMRSLRIALGQAVRTLEGRGDIRVRMVDMPFVVDCCMFLIQPDGSVLGPVHC